jgi:hypothetical protein
LSKCVSVERVGLQTNIAAGESALQEEALRACQRLEQQLNDSDANNVPAGQIPASNPQLTSPDVQPTNTPMPTDMASSQISTIESTTPVHAEAPEMPSGAQNESLASSITQSTSKMIPSWMEDAKRRFELVFAASNHKSVIGLWLEFEALLSYPADRKTRLTNQSRPQQLSDWMQRHRVWDKAPPVEKASEFGAMWRAWWKILQPEWRITDGTGWPLVRDGPAGEVWPNLLKGGGNGFVLVLLSLSWWMMRERDETRNTVESSSALADVEWALGKMVQVLRAQREQVEGEEDEDPNTRPTKR